MRERRKEPRRGECKVPETVCLQAVGGLCPQGNVRPRAFCIMILRVTVSGKVKSLDEAEAKASLNRAIQLAGIDAKRDDLPMARLKVG